jgi:hypothetical protein
LASGRDGVLMILVFTNEDGGKYPRGGTGHGGVEGLDGYFNELSVYATDYFHHVNSLPQILETHFNFSTLYGERGLYFMDAECCMWTF